jgi:hypothetical protein
VLVFHAQNAAFAVDRLNREVRGRYPPPGELTVASVVVMSLVPPSSVLGPHGAGDVLPAGGCLFATRGRPGGLGRDPGGLDRPRHPRLRRERRVPRPRRGRHRGEGTVLGRPSGANLAATTLELLQTA